MFLATGPGSILGAQIFSIKEVFCGQNEENMSHHAIKTII